MDGPFQQANPGTSYKKCISRTVLSLSLSLSLSPPSKSVLKSASSRARWIDEWQSGAILHTRSPPLACCFIFPRWMIIKNIRNISGTAYTERGWLYENMATIIIRNCFPLRGDLPTKGPHGTDGGHLLRRARNETGRNAKRWLTKWRDFLARNFEYNQTTQHIKQGYSIAAAPKFRHETTGRRQAMATKRKSVAVVPTKIIMLHCLTLSWSASRRWQLAWVLLRWRRFWGMWSYAPVQCSVVLEKRDTTTPPFLDRRVTKEAIGKPDQNGRIALCRYHRHNSLVFMRKDWQSLWGKKFQARDPGKEGCKRHYDRAGFAKKQSPPLNKGKRCQVTPVSLSFCDNTWIRRSSAKNGRVRLLPAGDQSPVPVHQTHVRSLCLLRTGTRLGCGWETFSCSVFLRSHFASWLWL